MTLMGSCWRSCWSGRDGEDARLAVAGVRRLGKKRPPRRSFGSRKVPALLRRQIEILGIDQVLRVLVG